MPADTPAGSQAEAQIGRPRQFDPTGVLDTFVKIFSERGYEATSMADITEATGLSKSSLYNAFGSKRELLEQALDHYFDLMFSQVESVLQDGTAGLDDLHAYTALKREVTRSDMGRNGCLAINTATEMAYHDEAMAIRARGYRERLRHLSRLTLQRAAALGEIDPSMIDTYNEQLLATTLSTALITRAGADPEEREILLHATDALIESFHLPRRP
jgi:AcrR family transcriptional regulator